MASYKNIDGEESGTVTFTVAAVELTRNSSAELQEILCVGDPDISTNVGRVTSVPPDSTMAGVGVRIISGPSSLADFPVRVIFPSTATNNPVSLPNTQTINVRSSAANALVSVYQSTAADLNVTVAGYVAPSTTVTVNGNASSNSSLYLPVRLTNGTAFLTAGADYTDGSTASNIAGPTLLFDNGTNATMRVVSLTNGLPVNVVAGAAAGSTLITVRQSTVGDLRAAVYQSTAADLNVTVAGYVAPSTTVQVSSVGGAVVVRSSAADQLVTVYQSTFADLRATVHNSTIGDLLASVQQNSTVWQVQNKPVFPTILSTSILVTSTHSTAVYELIASGAGLRQKVCAYIVGSTHTNPSTLVFMSSLAIDRWHVPFGSGSSGMTGANLANAIPIFMTDAANALNCRVEGGSSVTATVVTRVSVSYVAEA